MMKILFDKIIIDPAIRIEQQQIKKKSLIGKMRFHKRQKCYELNLTTGLITEAEMQNTIDLKGNSKHRVDIKEQCIYTVAINLANAKRKFLSRLYKHVAK